MIEEPLQPLGDEQLSNIRDVLNRVRIFTDYPGGWRDGDQDAMRASMTPATNDEIDLALTAVLGEVYRQRAELADLRLENAGLQRRAEEATTYNEVHAAESEPPHAE